MAKRSSYAYGSVPMIHHSRSKFDLSYSHKATLNVGKLVPLYCQEVYPGDSFKCDANVVARVTSSFLKPVMDNLFCDVMFFYVPSRTIFDQWAEIFGENNQSAWARQTTVSSPQLDDGSVTGVVTAGSIANYLGLPVGLTNDNIRLDGGVSVLPFRAYAKIYNEWYRDENLVDPVNLQTGASIDSESINSNPFGPDNYTGMCANVAKLHDYFTQLLVAPQKGSPVELGTAVFPATNATVSSQPLNVYTTTGISAPTSSPALRWRRVGGGADVPSSGFLFVDDGITGHNNSDPSSGANTGNLYPANLVAGTAGLQVTVPETSVGSVSVNDLRMAFQMQKLLERDAVFGNRYTEYLQGHFGVTSPDARLQRSEFLGGRRFPISILQATQTSEATSNSPLGNVAGWSLSNGRAGYTKGFTEHGFVIGMFCVRQFHTYQQGIEKFWSRTNRVDYLDPLFTTVGFQPVFTKELYAGVNDGDQVFGYAPAFEDLRCRQNRVSGQLSTMASEGLDIWHFADYYASAPVLGQEWIEETPTYVDRALSVPSETVDQFIFDVYFKQYAIRVMPTWGMPGLIDHH